jgi:hypothetical protein
MEKEAEEIAKKFLHDLATPMTVIGTMIKRQLDEMKGAKPLSPPEHQIERMEKVLIALKKIELLHAEQKELIHKATFANHEKKAS